MSHLVPSRLYRYCESRGVPPLRFTAQEVGPTTEELKARLLCSQCENLLNRDGENWLVPKLATLDGSFPFYDLLVKGQPDVHDPGFTAYACTRHCRIALRDFELALFDLQQRFVDLRFGMFLGFNMATFQDREWGDPTSPPDLFDPTALDTDQWAAAARSANMTWGCLTTRHHDGFCISPTKTREPALAGHLIRPMSFTQNAGARTTAF